MKCHYSREVFWRAVAQSQNFRIYCCSSGPRKILIAFLAADIQMKAVTPSSETFTDFFSSLSRSEFFSVPTDFFSPRIFYSRGFPSGPGMSIMIFLGCLQSLFFLFKAHHFFLLSRSRDVAASLSKQCLAWTVSNRDLGTNS